MAGVRREQNTLVLGLLESHAQEVRSLNKPKNIYGLPKLIPSESGGYLKGTSVPRNKGRWLRQSSVWFSLVLSESRRLQCTSVE